VKGGEPREPFPRANLQRSDCEKMGKRNEKNSKEEKKTQGLYLEGMTRTKKSPLNTKAVWGPQDQKKKLCIVSGKRSAHSYAGGKWGSQGKSMKVGA